MSAIPFRKMNGLGNEFLVFDARNGPVRLSEQAIRALGREDEIGFDHRSPNTEHRPLTTDH
jgi:diaminopimelate epimerase